MIRKGCLILVSVCAGTWAAYVGLLWGRIREDGEVRVFPTLLLALFGALGLLWFVSMLRAVIFGKGDEGAIRRSQRGLPLEDGRVEAVWGPIEPLGATLEAPFSGRTCVAYEYDAKSPKAYDPRGYRLPPGSTATGFALAPCVIRSSRGSVNLLGFGLLTKFPAKAFDDAASRDRAVRYARSTPCTEMGVSKLGAMMSAMEAAISDDDGSVRQDLRMSGSSPDDVASCTLEERAIAPGETVTAMGIWDAARGGLVPKLRGRSAIVRILPGGGPAMLAFQEKRPWLLLFLSFFWAALAHAFLVLVVANGSR